MSQTKAKRAVQMIARREGISVKKVLQEIEDAMRAAWSNPDPKIQSFWKNVPCKEEHPTPIELISYLSEIEEKKLPTSFEKFVM